jgi:glycosyltransferase involved in cell wall biosynthesis
MLLPSLGEMFGIAPCEAAQFGRPSLVSDVGGLSTVVINNETGYTLPLTASANEYADKIENLCYNTDLYQALSQAAQLRAKTVLNWDVWAHKTVDIFHAVINSVPITHSKL